MQQKQLLELGCWRELLATPPWGRKSPPSPSIEGAQATFTDKYAAEDAQACEKLGSFRAGKLHHCLSAFRPAER